MTADRAASAPSAPQSATGGEARDAPVRPTLAVAILAPATRIALGALYLWAFFDKLLGLGLPTPSDGAVVAGSSPAAGYLASREGALAPAFQAMAGNPLVDALYMLSLGAVGVALVTGVCMWLAAIGGALLMGGIYLAELPLATNPLVDQHLVFVLLGFLLAAIGAGAIGGLGRWWQSRPFVAGRSLLH